MGSFKIEDRSGIAVIWLDRPPVNALDLDVLNELVDVLAEVEASQARAAVLTGRGAIFSAGADLMRVLASDDSYVKDAVAALSRAFGALFTFPLPIVAAINGHAIAGGAILVCACDHKVMGEDGTIGVSELRVGVPFPLYALEIVRFAVTPQRFQEIIFRARNYDPDAGRALGFVDELVPTAEVLDRALRRADELASIPRETFRVMKEAVRAPTVRRVRDHAAAHDERAAELWASGDVREAIRSFLDKTLGRSS